MAWTDTGGGDHGGDDWTISSNTTIGGNHYNILTFKVNSGVTATLDTENILEIHAESIDIDGTIDGDGKGYAGAEAYQSDGEGDGGGYNGTSYSGGGGGGYGGHGGTGLGGDGGSGGASYGSSITTIVQLGSGGGNTSSASIYGGDGGGAAMFFADDITISGNVTVDGTDGAGGASFAAGGGSGGGLYFACNDITVDSGATVSANGGSGGTQTADGYNGGRGGGGRIKICYYGSYTNNGTVQANMGSSGGTSGAANGSVQSFNLAQCDSTYSVGQTFTTTAGGASVLASVTIYVETVSTAGDFTLKIWDSTSKSVEQGTATETISATGEKTFTFSTPVELSAGTTYYLEINPDSTGDIQVAVDAYNDSLGGAMYYGSNGHNGMDMYLTVSGYGYVSNPIIYNTADLTKQCHVANAMLCGAIHRINADGTGYLEYTDDFTTAKYVADNDDNSGLTHDTTNSELDIADGGYIDYLFDCRYPVADIPILTATIALTSGTPTIQISVDGSTWYNIDTAIVDDVSTEYELDNATSLSLKGKTAFYVRFDCSAVGVFAMTLKEISIRVDFITIDAELPVIYTGGSNTFRCDADDITGLGFTVDIIHRDRKWAG